MTIAFSSFPNVTSNVPLTRRLPWFRFAATMTQHTERITKDGPLWSPAVYPAGARRSRSAVQSISCLVADVDHNAKPDTFDIVSDALDGICHLVHTSHSHTPEECRFRVIVPLDHPLDAAAFDDVFEAWKLWFLHCRIRVDSACSDPCRIFYLPSCPPGAARRAYSRAGRPLTIDADLPRRAARPKPVAPVPVVPASAPEPGIIITKYVQAAFSEGNREINCFRLAQQLRDNGYSRSDAEAAAQIYQAQVSGWGKDPFRPDEAIHAVETAYKRAPRQPWSRRTPGYAAIR